MNYNKFNDNELVYMIHEDDETATNLIVEKYKPLILKILKDYITEYNIIGIEISDMYQEGLIGLIHAIKTFNKDKDTLFYTYASKCIKTTIMSAIRNTFRSKNRALNNSFSLDSIVDGQKYSLQDLFADETHNPDKILISKDEEISSIKKLKSMLSKNERSIFDLKLKGLSNREVAVLLDKDIKYIENTLYRIKNKYKSINKIYSTVME